MKSPNIFLAFLLGMTSFLSAQTTWIVDAGGGTGSHFKDLPKAVQRAKDGDILLVRPGRYHAVTIQGKGLSILGGSGVEIMPPASQQAFTVSGLPAKSKVHIRGLSFTEWPFGASESLLISSCKGLVLIEECNILEPSLSFGPALNIVSSDQVVMNHSTVRQGIVSFKSRLVFNASLSYGKQRSLGFPGISTYSGTLELNQATIVPSDQVGHSAGLNPYGVLSDHTQILVRGDARSLIQGARNQFLKQLSGFFDKGGSSLEIDPSVRYNGSLASFGNQAVKLQMPSLVTRGTSLGGSIHGELYPPDNSAFVLWSALVSQRIVTNLGYFWLDLGSLHPQMVGQVKARKQLKYSLRIPKIPQLLGLPLAFQALSWDKTGFQFSNPGITVVKG